MKKILSINCFLFKKLSLFMKLTVLFLFISLVSIQAESYAQSAKLSVNVQNGTLYDVVSQIEKQSEFMFFYKSEDVDSKYKVNINAKEKAVDEILDQAIINTDLTYSISNKHILISKKSELQQTTPGSITIVGVVTDFNQAPLIGVSVTIKGTATGVSTDMDGKFSITVPDENTILRFAYLGFQSREIKIGSQRTLIVQLDEDLQLLDEVVVVGYGVSKKKDLTGAVSSVRASQLPPAANTSVAHMLSGKASGLTVMQQSAQPGGGISMQIRGQSSNRAPLIVIDGFAQTGFSQPGGGYVGSLGDVETSLNSLNPNDIESIEVMKDASATSIYGARAAGGVILITTKRGKEGKVEVNYKGSLSAQRFYGLPTMLDPTNFMIESNEVVKETWMRGNLVYPYGTKTYDQAIAEAQAAGKPIWQPKYTDGQIANPPAGTDWLNEITNEGFIQEHNLSIQGGTEKTKYLASLGYYDQTGSIKTNDLSRFTTRFNLDQQFSKYISGGITANISQIKTRNVPLGTGGNEGSGIIRSALQFNPLIDVKNEAGEYNLDPGQAFLANPVSLLEISDYSTTERLLMTSYVQAQPIKDLSLRALLGFDRNQGMRDYYLPTSVLYGKREGGYASKYQNAKTDYTFNFIANYKKTIGIHDFALTAGYEYQKFTWDGMGAYNSQFPYDGVLWYNLASGEREKPGVSSSGGNSQIASYLGRVNYTLMNKYLLTINFRADGSSNFADNNKWGYFPGISLGWKIHEENFMKGSSGWLSELKLRGGYGKTGNDNVSGIFTYYSTGWNYILGGKYTNGIGLAALGNPDLKWETQTDMNIGLDFGFFKHRLSGTVEVFDRKVTDILGDKSLMSYHEVNTIKANLDAIKQSNGIEFSLRSRNMVEQNFTWSTDFNMTFYRDKWKQRDPSWKPDIYNDYNAYFNELWYYRSEGLVSVDDTEYIKKYGAIPGTVKIKDVNGYKLDDNGQRVLDANGKPTYSGEADGKIDNADLVKVGVNTPYTLGLNNSFTLKDFDLNIYFYGMFNRWKINDTKSYYVTEAFRLKDGANMYNEVVDRWSYDNMTSKEPSIFQVNAKYGAGEFYLEDAWFIHCKNITLGYTIPKHIIGKYLNHARIFADAQNVFVITPYSGSDPETDAMAAYPNQRSFTIGIDIKF